MAKVLSWKYANLSGRQVAEDMKQNHGTNVSRKLIQGVNRRVGDILIDKEKKWTYVEPELCEEVSIISISRDGTTIPIKAEGYKEAMAGTISLYNGNGDRLHTIYTGCSPEHGKAVFDHVFSQEIAKTKARHPDADYLGVADGDQCNWTFLDRHTDTQILDFWHASGYLGEYAAAVYQDPQERKVWVESGIYFR